MADDKVKITPAMITQALGNSTFKLSVLERDALAKGLEKLLNPPKWVVQDAPLGPEVGFRGTTIRLKVFTGQDTTLTTKARRLHIAEMVAQVLNDRELEVTL